MIHNIITYTICVLFCFQLKAQVYAPPAGELGTTAMYKDSSAFINWASNCTVTRGLQDISNTSLGYANVGNNTMALGVALSNGVVSLGDGGNAICEFPFPIQDGAGNDFAVFENSFDGLFLELAFVEVSSDGVNYFRFPCHSLVDTSKQVGSFDSTDATQIHNFAGKYKVGYGTPFDLNDITNNLLLNKNKITHVKIIDCVGSINNSYATRDAYNNKVNDPWPTAFGSSGFDLDAIGVIHQNTIIGINEPQTLANNILTYPNPIKQNQPLQVKTLEPIISLSLYTITGQKISESNSLQIQIEKLNSGIYYLKIELEKTSIVKKIIVE